MCISSRLFSFPQHANKHKFQADAAEKVFSISATSVTVSDSRTVFYLQKSLTVSDSRTVREQQTILSPLSYCPQNFLL